MRRLPFTTGADLRAIYPDGLLAVDHDEPVRLHTSSGTTGKPKALFFSRQDVDNAAELIARSLVMTGITRKDVFQNMMSYGLFTGGAGHALRRGESRLPRHPRRPGHLRTAVDADAGLPHHRRPYPAQLRALLRQLPRTEGH